MNNNQEISKITMVAMIVVALFFDGIQAGTVYIFFIPFVGFILEPLIAAGASLFAFMTFFLWFNLSGIKFNSKIATTIMGTFFIELIPLLNTLPAWTLSMVITFLFLKTKKIAGGIIPGSENLSDKI